MSSPMDMFSSESTPTEDPTRDATPTPASAEHSGGHPMKTLTIKQEVLESPTPDFKPKLSQVKKSSHSRSASAASITEDGMDGGGQLSQSSSRKKRARATPCEDPEMNGRKSAASDCSGRESSLWPGGEGEGPVQGSLLEEVLAEKRMALMRSPEVIQFLQNRQLMVQAAQHHALLHPHTHTPTPAPHPHFCVGEVEDDANS